MSYESFLHFNRRQSVIVCYINTLKQKTTHNAIYQPVRRLQCAFICVHHLLYVFCELILLPRPRYIGDGVLFSIDFFLCLYLCLFLSFFLSFFVSLLARSRETGWTDLHETFREGVEWPWNKVIQFLVNSEKPLDAAMSNTGTGFVVLSHHSLFFAVILPYCG